MSRKNTRSKYRWLQQLPRAAREAIIYRLTYIHFTSYTERRLWKDVKRDMRTGRKIGTLAMVLKRNHRYDNEPKPISPLYKALHKQRRELKRFIERAKAWKKEHPVNPFEDAIRILREHFPPEEFRRRICNYPVPGGWMVDGEFRPNKPVEQPSIKDRIIVEPGSPLYEALNERARKAFETNLSKITDPILDFAVGQLDPKRYRPHFQPDIPGPEDVLDPFIVNGKQCGHYGMLTYKDKDPNEELLETLLKEPVKAIAHPERLFIMPMDGDAPQEKK